MSFSRKILVGLAAGVATGLFFGERAAVLEWAADGFVKLLQMTVLPYVTVSIVSSLGRLDYASARALGLRVGGVIVALWVLALAFAFLIPLTFPQFENASFFSTALVERRAAFDFVALYIPSNPFYSLANNIVPAVVLFSVVLGVALIGVERKRALLDVLQVVGEALSRTTRFVSMLTPYGLFAIAATAAGTLDVEQLGRLQIYLLAYVAMSLLASLWVLPGLIAAVTPVPALALLRGTRDSLITAFVAGDLFIVLPSLIEQSKALLRSHGVLPEAAGLPDVIVPASFNLPHSGKLLSISFILFAGWFSDAVVPMTDYPQSGARRVSDVLWQPQRRRTVPPRSVSHSGRHVSAVSCHRRDQLAVRHAPRRVAHARRFRDRHVRDGRGAHVESAADASLWDSDRGRRRAWFSAARARCSRRRWRRSTRRTSPGADEPLARAGGDDRSARGSGDRRCRGLRARLSAIRVRGTLRVGYLPGSLPFAFNNARGDLVGFDIELAHRLAEELAVGLELVVVPRERFAAFVNGGECDLVMSGVRRHYRARR